MPTPPTRGIRVFRYAVLFDGIDDCAKIEPFTVYGWSEITIQEWIYFYHPKSTSWWSRTGMIGDPWIDYPSTSHFADNRFDYTQLSVRFDTRTPAETKKVYDYGAFAYRNTWINIARRFTSAREFSVWVNAVRVYYATVPSGEKTILEWNPDSATRPTRYKRFTLGANVDLGEHLKIAQHSLLIYSRALSESELIHNMLYPWDPVRDGLRVWLFAHPDYVKDIDSDGILEWIDLSGNSNHAKLYGAMLVEAVRTPRRKFIFVRTL